MKYKFVTKTVFDIVCSHEFEADSDTIREFIEQTYVFDNISLPWRIFDGDGNLIAEGKTNFDEETQTIRFTNGLHTIRAGSIIEYSHGYPEAYQMRVDRFEKGFVVLKSPGTSWGRKENEGEIWDFPSTLEHEYFVKH